MSRGPSQRLLSLIVVGVFLSMLSACGGGSGTPTLHPAYSLSAGAANPASVNAGATATSTITVTPGNGYTGSVTLSCGTPSGGGTPPPTCSFGTNPVMVNGAAAASTLTLTTTNGTPNANYKISVTASDGQNAGPSNGAQNVALTTVGKIQHIIVIFQENRTPDNLFHDTNLINAGAHIASSGVNSTGQVIPLVPTTLGQDYDQSHTHLAFTQMCHLDTTSNTCKMDGADQILITCSKGATNCPPANPNFMYVQQSDVQPYFDMAEQYTFGDNMFQTNEGPSFPAHQFIIGGTSEPSNPSQLFVAENPIGIPNSSADTGCISANLALETVFVIDQSGNESSTIEPCFDHPSLTDELNTAGISWRYYAPLPGSIWTAPNAIQHMCVPVTQSDGSVDCTGSDWVNNVSLQTQQDMAPVLTEIAAGQLRQVSWVIPNGTNSDHSGMSTTTGGPSWVASIVNAIGNSSYWSNTAIILTWDDWGGWYDHVPPPQVIDDGTSWGSGYVYGFRVPLVVMAPYARAAYISHNQHDFGSVLNFIENNFGVAQMGFADTHASDDLSDCFNFDQTSITFKTINAPLKADFFIHDKRPPTGPDDD